MPRILIVLSGVDAWTWKDGTTEPTGYWAEEFVVPDKAFRGAGFDVTIATPGGRPPTPDELSFSAEMNNGSQEAADELRRYIATTAAAELAGPAVLEDLDSADFDAIFIPGGHGPMEDLAASAALGRLVTAFAGNEDKVVSAVCHGPAGLITAVDGAGDWVFAGRRLTSFSDLEETQYGYAEKSPFLLESRLRELGAVVEVPEPWAPLVVVDGNLVTGANPASSAGIADSVVELLKIRSV